MKLFAVANDFAAEFWTPSEVQEKTNTSTRNFQVIQELSNRSIVELWQGFDFDEDCAIHDNVRKEGADDDASKLNLKPDFFFRADSRLVQRDHHRSPENKFREPRSELPVHIVEAPDDSFSQITMDENRWAVHRAFRSQNRRHAESGAKSAADC